MTIRLSDFAGHSPAPFECVEGVIYDANLQPLAEVTPSVVADIDAKLLAAAPEMLAEVARLITENGLLREALNLAANGDKSNPVVAARLAELLAQMHRG